MNAIFVLNQIHTQNEAFSCIFGPCFIAHNKKNIISGFFCNTIFWVRSIFSGRSWEGKHVIFYLRPSGFVDLHRTFKISGKSRLQT